MAGTPYLLNCLSTHNIDICGVSEHWLREYNMSFFDTFKDCGYAYIAKPVYEIDPLRYKCNIRGGVAILYRTKSVHVQEIFVDSPRIIGIEIHIPNGEYIYCFLAYMPASSRPIEVFIDHIDILESLFSVYSERGKVIIIGDLNVKIKGPRYQFKDDDRSSTFQTFLDRSNLLSVNVQSECKGPVHTFFPQTGHCTGIDHVLIESSMYDLVKSCEVLDDNVINVSEHNPIVCSLNIPVSSYSTPPDLVKYSWKKRYATVA